MKAKVIIPLHDNIVVQLDEVKKESPGGILLPDAAQDKPSSGTVLSVGPGKLLEDGRRQNMDLKRGDVILFNRWSAATNDNLNDDLVIVAQTDVLAKTEYV